MSGNFEWVKPVLDVINGFFVVYLIGYSTFLFLSVVVGSSVLYKRRKQEKLKSILQHNYKVPISILVPAYNEEITVVETVRSLLDLDYELYEIVVIDDGSQDNTSEKLINAFHMHAIRRPMHYKIPCQPIEFIYETMDEKVPLTLIRKSNGGKADSLNLGINACRYPYFICMDADSALQHDSLTKIMQPILSSKDTVAVGGVIRPANDVELEHGRVVRYKLPANLIACMQALEYDRSFLASRILLAQFNGSLIISGAFGLFKKDIVIQAGGYDTATVGEDMELVVKLHEYCIANDLPYRVEYVPDTVCWSQAPERLRDLCKQRKRWHLGLFQSMWKHRTMLVNPKYGAVSLISYFYFLVYELLSPFIEILGIFSVLAAYVFDLINVRFMVLFFLIYTVFGCVLTLTVFFARIYTADLKMTPKDAAKAIFLCFFEVAFLRFVLSWVRATAFWGYQRQKLNWGKIQRQKLQLK